MMSLLIPYAMYFSKRVFDYGIPGAAKGGGPPLGPGRAVAYLYFFTYLKNWCKSKCIKKFVHVHKELT